MPEAKITGEKWVGGRFVPSTVTLIWQDLEDIETRFTDTNTHCHGGARCNGPNHPAGTPGYKISGSREVSGSDDGWIMCKQAYRRLPSPEKVANELRNWRNVAVLAGYKTLPHR